MHFLLSQNVYCKVQWARRCLISASGTSEWLLSLAGGLSVYILGCKHRAGVWYNMMGLTFNEST